MNPSTKVEKWFNEYKAENRLPAETIVDEGELLRWLAVRKPKMQQRSVSGSLPQDAKAEVIDVLEKLIQNSHSVDADGEPTAPILDIVDTWIGLGQKIYYVVCVQWPLTNESANII